MAGDGYEENEPRCKVSGIRLLLNYARSLLFLIIYFFAMAKLEYKKC